VPVLILRGLTPQIIIVLLVSLFSVAIFMYFNPYIHIHDNNLAILAQWSITLVVISALIIKVQAIPAESNESGLGIVLILLNLAILVVALTTAILNSKERADGVKDDEDEKNIIGKDATYPEKGPAEEEKDVRSDCEEEGSIDSDDDVNYVPDHASDRSISKAASSSLRGEREIEMSPLHGGRMAPAAPNGVSRCNQAIVSMPSSVADSDDD
jgi:hypothetical protein